jgi:hypothetical protein
MDFSILIDYIPYILILGGVVATSWFLEKVLRPVPVVGKPASTLTKILSFFGFFAGILLVLTGGVAWQIQTSQIDFYTQLLLLIAGLALILRPIKDFPWAALIGLIFGVLCTGAVYFFYPLGDTVFGIASTWIYLLIFLIPAFLVYIIFKFIEDFLKLLGTFLASRPITLLVGFICIAQGILLLLDKNLFDILLA